MTQLFKGDADELKFYESGRPIVETVNVQRDLMLEDVYNCFALGEILFDNMLAPLANSIKRSIFRETFSEIFSNTFVNCGIAEAYISIFKKIFGETVAITFTVSAPGKLAIDIVAEGVELSDMLARTIVDNAYEFSEVVDYDGDNIAFQTVKGFTSQYELEQMLKEMVPAGIWPDISLTLA